MCKIIVFKTRFERTRTIGATVCDPKWHHELRKCAVDGTVLALTNISNELQLEEY